MSGNLVRGFAVASATAVTTVGAVAGVGQSGTGEAVADAGTTASGSTLLADIPLGSEARIQTASLNRQADAQSVAADTSARQTAAEAARVQAAKDAIAKQKEAKRQEAERKEAEQKALRDAKDRQQEQEQQAGGSSTEPSGVTQQSSYSVADVQAIARQIVPGGQFTCFSNIVDHESDWNYKAVNPSSGAYGLVQAYPGSKMSSAGADWRTNPATQIKWGLNYMNERYGSPCDAWAFWQANGSY
ncbi:transglycosylase SLT domain-containing protein [Streptomyces sp. SP17KL33]|uniref:aggregation-promoting factor C-terminal-like domain-containing protein n=1 Tax=Streptomyces sp. SP17KL33 TaxID=3002534 RepID=UPI002E79226E|nr:transglycosylase SLT domain-containing protein [Streptomyces sp. SP17KL33]MEE1837632.1 transglycosylase SLT domain-containing protein [Streptomyces sp. SP17KL33]